MFHPEGGQRVPVLLWARKASRDVVDQLIAIASQPWVRHRVAAMPDVHVASGVAVGTVFATENEVVPAALGGDLGCGMSAVRLGISASIFDRRTRERVVAELDRAIPSGDRSNAHDVAVPDALFEAPLSTHALERTRAALGPRHLGTLGGGNHFVELLRDADDDAWLTVHSGSRGLGAAIAAHHARAAIAARLDGSIAALDVREDAGAAYVRDVLWALTFAAANRALLAARAIEAIARVLRVSIDAAPLLDVPHNHVAREDVDGAPLWVHRKGAIAAKNGALALIPGSMGTATYVVEGKGEASSFQSASHGAGRVLTRTAARGAIDLAAFARAMGDIAYPKGRGRALVEEAPAAYRDIREVLADEQDLVQPLLRLEPMAVLKG